MKGLKEIREALFGLYETGKEIAANPDTKLEAIPLEKFKGMFADELYAVAMQRMKANESRAAEGVVFLSCVQALALDKRGVLMERRNLRFQETADEIIKSMAGYEVIGAQLLLNGAKVEHIEKVEDGDVVMLALMRTNGIEESVVMAEIENDFINNKVLFVLEPFADRPWTEMTDEERRSLEPGKLRPASNMPKRMMKRRVEVAGWHVRFDNRTGWLEVHYKQIEPFERTKEEEQALIDEFKPSTEAVDESAPEAKGPTAEEIEKLTSNVNAANIEDDALLEALQGNSQTDPALAEQATSAVPLAAESDIDELEVPE